MVLDSTTSAPPTAGGSSSNENVQVQNYPKVTYQLFWLRLQSIPSTIQFTLAHSSSAPISAAADMGETEFLEDQEKSFEVVSQLLSSSPLAAKMDDEDRESFIWEIIDTTGNIIDDHRHEETNRINKIWIINVTIEQSSISSDYGYQEEEDGGEEEGECEGEGEGEGEDQNDAGFHGIDEKEEEEEEEEGTTPCKCAICCEGIPGRWWKDYCPNQDCPSRRCTRPTLCLSVFF